MTFVASLLIQELKNRRNRNSKYGLRSFARDIDLSPSRLSEIMNNKQGLSHAKAESLAEKLKLQPKIRQMFIAAVDMEFSRNKHVKENAKIQFTKLNYAHRKLLDQHALYLLSHWLPLALFELLKLQQISHNTQVIAKFLNVKPSEITKALKTLNILGMIEKNSDRWVIISEDPSTTTDIPSASIQKLHKQFLEIAKDKISNISVDKREFGTTLMAIDSKSIPEVKKMLRDFRREIEAMCAQSKELDNVYALSTLFFPLIQVDEL